MQGERTIQQWWDRRTPEERRQLLLAAGMRDLQQLQATMHLSFNDLDGTQTEAVVRAYALHR